MVVVCSERFDFEAETMNSLRLKYDFDLLLVNLKKLLVAMMAARNPHLMAHLNEKG